MSHFAIQADKNYYPDPNDKVMDSLFKQYERVIIESIITSFGLDMLIGDRHGGDVDTIHNVRKVGSDPLMEYKNSTNKTSYDNRSPYDNVAYHKDSRYRQTVASAKKEFQEHGTWIQDTYVAGNTVAPVQNNTVPRGRQGQLDHVVAAEEIHNDPGRVLAGVDGMALANDPDNLRYTNAALNNNMRNKSVEEYIQWCEQNPDKVNWRGNKGEPLPEDIKQKLREEYHRAHKAYDQKLNHAYYTSPKFMSDTAKAAGKVAGKMALRQAFGLIFTEIWFAVKDKFQCQPQPFDFGKLLSSIGDGIKLGIERAKSKYKEIISKVIDGAVSGALSSLTTTLCNIFFSTDKNVVHLIRQAYASFVEAAKVLFINPDNYAFGDRMKAVTKILATGASVILGTVVTEAVAKTPMGAIPVVGDIISAFCGSMVSGILTCSFLYFMDRSELIQKLVSFLNGISTIDATVNYFKQQAEYFERYAAELMRIDLVQFKKEVAQYSDIAAKLEQCSSERELNIVLKRKLQLHGIKPAWQGDFSSHMSNKKGTLVFG